MEQVVLVVDDDAAMAEAVAVFLEAAGYACILAANGKLALDVLCARHVDLVIADLMMPVMSGAELMLRMRREPTLAAIPVVLCSGYPESVVRDASLQYQAFLGKPFPIQDVVGVVQRLLACVPEDAMRIEGSAAVDESGSLPRSGCSPGR